MAENHEKLPDLPGRDVAGAFERIEQHQEIPSMMRRVSRKMLDAVSVNSFKFNPKRFTAIYDNLDGDILTDKDVDGIVHDYNPRTLAKLNSLSLRSVILMPGENHIEHNDIVYTLRGNLERAILPEEGALRLPKMVVELFGFRQGSDRATRRLWQLNDYVKITTVEDTENIAIAGIPNPRADEMIDAELIIDSVIKASKS